MSCSTSASRCFFLDYKILHCIVTFSMAFFLYIIKYFLGEYIFQFYNIKNFNFTVMFDIFFSWGDWKRSIWSIQRFRSSIKPFPNLAYFRAEGAGRTHQQYTRGTGEETNNFISCQSSPEFTCSCKNLNGEPTESPGWERRGSRVSGF